MYWVQNISNARSLVLATHGLWSTNVTIAILAFTGAKDVYT